jgi:hypothetical protein
MASVANRLPAQMIEQASHRNERDAAIGAAHLGIVRLAIPTLPRS